MILGIIPARAGSKRIPGKNLKLLGGRPLIEWTIRAAKGSRVLDRFVVATEDDEIAEVAETCGAEVFRRPASMATDTASVYDTVFAVLNEIGAEWVVLLHPTSPFRTAGDIDACVESCIARSAPSCVSVESTRPVPNGAVYVAYVSWLREHRNFDGPRTIVHQMPSYRSVDIDTPEDWARAEAIAFTA